MSSLPVLDAVEARILGVLLEKEKATPEYYPMTVNSIMNGCNQKSSRNPVVQYDELTVQTGIDGLKKAGLCNTVTGGGSRVLKYKHNASIAFQLDEREEATLCLLLLRGPLTPGEIKSASGRLYEFENLESVHRSLEKLMQMESPLVVQLQRRPGQKEARYMHLLCGPVDETQWEETTTPVMVSGSKLEERVTQLEQEVAELKAKLHDLMKLLE
jgi:uncharacterized protein YceH (UPF0502 family)